MLVSKRHFFLYKPKVCTVLWWSFTEGAMWERYLISENMVDKCLLSLNRLIHLEISQTQNRVFISENKIRINFDTHVDFAFLLYNITITFVQMLLTKKKPKKKKKKHFRLQEEMFARPENNNVLEHSFMQQLC